jgi:hypothetical protein
MQKNYDASKLVTETPGKIRCKNLKIFMAEF